MASMANDSSGSNGAKEHDVPPVGIHLLAKACMWDLTRDSTALAAMKVPDVTRDPITGGLRVDMNQEEGDNSSKHDAEVLGEGHKAFFNFASVIKKTAAEKLIAEVKALHPEIRGLNAELIAKTHAIMREELCPCDQKRLPGRYLLLLQMTHGLAKPNWTKCKLRETVIDILTFIINLEPFGLRPKQLASERANHIRAISLWKLATHWSDLEVGTFLEDRFKYNRKDRRALQRMMDDAIKCDDFHELLCLGLQTFAIYLKRNPERAQEFQHPRWTIMDTIIDLFQQMGCPGPRPSSS